MDERIEMTDGAETLSFPVSAAAAMEALGWKRTPAEKKAEKKLTAPKGKPVNPPAATEGVVTNRSNSKSK